MSLSERELQQALEACAEEPVHIPGSVQPFGCLIAVDLVTQATAYASENVEEITGFSLQQVLSTRVSDLLGNLLWHNVKNAMARPRLKDASQSIGVFTFNQIDCAVSVFESAGHLILEIERDARADFDSQDSLKQLTFLMEHLQDAQSVEALCQMSCKLMRHLTGYDRIMVYKFDRDYNGEVIAEERKSAVEPFLGLRFPHWDIPAQARDIMLRLPLRMISDAHQTPVPLRAAKPDAAPLDISLAQARGVSPVHMQYLHNLDIRGTLTLSIVLEGSLWGIISFHHRRPMVPAPALRDLLTAFIGLFRTKLQTILQADHMALIERVDGLRERSFSDLENSSDFKDLAAKLQEILPSDGCAIDLETRSFSAGQVPDQPLMAQLRDLSLAKPNEIISFESLGQAFPSLDNVANGCAGALVVSAGPNQTLYFFRRETARDVSWAGNPEKTIEDHDGQKRLAPRGSFSTYLEQVRGACAPWSDQDCYMASRIWSLVNVVERREMLNSLNRQQQIMIDELNHRVRNILALIRSVSQQASRSAYGSLQSYSRSLEARIQALASSHDLASGSVITIASVRDLIQNEFQPYLEDASPRLHLSMPEELYLRADSSPIFSLVIHELVTNAVKYGALSNETGVVHINVTRTAEGLEMHWREEDGPPVSPPKVLGFGSTLIQQAIPHEMDGRANLVFNAAGVEADLFLPQSLLQEPNATVQSGQSIFKAVSPEDLHDLPLGRCLVLEDNFVISEGLRTQLEELGIEEVDTVSNLRSAMESLEDARPDVAVLDINLGGGQTSEPVALHLLQEGIPFILVTGYGEAIKLNAALDSVLRVTKPAGSGELSTALRAAWEAHQT